MVDLGNRVIKKTYWTPERILNLRHTLSYTQRDLANHMCVALYTVSRWENGHSRPANIYVRMLNELATMAKLHFEGYENAK